jgi:hypothetical protein
MDQIDCPVTPDMLHRFQFRATMPPGIAYKIKCTHPNAVFSMIYDGKKKDRRGKPVEMIVVLDGGKNYLYLSHHLEVIWTAPVEDMLDVICVLALQSR